MQLSRDAIQRMIGGVGFGVGFGGGGGNGGGVSLDYLFSNFVAMDYWNQIFVVHGKQKVTVTDGTSGTQTVTITDVELPPNSTPSTTTNTDSETGDVTVTEITIESIEVKYNFWSDGGVSALGTNGSGGGGGGDTLNALLANINDSTIGDVAPTPSEVGKCLVYNGNGEWDWATPGGGGGGLTYGLSWSYGSVTSASGGSYDGSASKSFVIPKNTGDLTNNSGFITSSALLNYVPMSDVNKTTHGAFGKIPFVNNSGNMDIGKDLEFHASDSGTEDYTAIIMLNPSTTYTNNPILYIPNTSGTIALTSDLNGYATQTWVQTQGYLTTESYLGTVTSISAGTGLSSSTGGAITSSGTLSISSSYRTYISHGETAYNNQGNYLLKVQGMRFLKSGSYIAARFVNADGTYDDTRAAAAQGDGYIEWWSTGGLFNHQMGNITIGQNIYDTTHYIQIGGGRIYWDDNNSSLYVQKADGSSCHLYATGNVSALGSGGGLGDLAVGKLTINTGTDGITLKDSHGDVHLKLDSNGYLTLDNNLILSSGKQVAIGKAAVMEHHFVIDNYVKFESSTEVINGQTYPVLYLKMKRPGDSNWTIKNTWHWN